MCPSRAKTLWSFVAIYGISTFAPSPSLLSQFVGVACNTRPFECKLLLIVLASQELVRTLTQVISLGMSMYHYHAILSIRGGSHLGLWLPWGHALGPLGNFCVFCVVLF